jgi:hypothetical protein
MRTQPLIYILGFSGLIPFVIGPLWLTVAPGTVPPWLNLDHVWLLYAGMIASFMAGSFWGLALIVSEGVEGMIGLAMSGVLMILSWGAMLLPFKEALMGLAVVFLLQALAEIWRERTLDPMSGYFTLRITLTVGVLLTLAWRLALGVPAT